MTFSCKCAHRTNESSARWTIHEGDEVTAEGQVVWDDKQKGFVLNAPSLMVAPLSAGLIKLRVKNGPETF